MASGQLSEIYPIHGFICTVYLEEQVNEAEAPVIMCILTHDNTLQQSVNNYCIEISIHFFPQSDIYSKRRLKKKSPAFLKKIGTTGSSSAVAVVFLLFQSLAHTFVDFV